MQQRTTGGDDFAAGRHRLKQDAVELAETQRHRLLAGAQHVLRPGAEAQADDRAARIVRPAGTALAAPERQHGQSVAVRFAGNQVGFRRRS